MNFSNQELETKKTKQRRITYKSSESEIIEAFKTYRITVDHFNRIVADRPEILEKYAAEYPRPRKLREVCRQVSDLIGKEFPLLHHIETKHDMSSLYCRNLFTGELEQKFRCTVVLVDNESTFTIDLDGVAKMKTSGEGK